MALFQVHNRKNSEHFDGKKLTPLSFVHVLVCGNLCSVVLLDIQDIKHIYWLIGKEN